MHLEKIKSPGDLNPLNYKELVELAAEMREFIVQAVAKTGGHLGSNLGAVELTIALHRIFKSPQDVIIWDTGHQTYVHKMITGRQADFSQLRKRNGLSGYPSSSESEHDFVENSHASTSLSWASGLVTGFELTGQESRRAIAVIGDGSMTGGMAFEALNNLGHYGQKAIIVLNDNGRSYAPTVSRLSTAVSRLRQSPNYWKGRQAVTSILDKIPLGGEVKRGLSGAAAAMRDMWEPPAFFETLGVRYLGPIDGHDFEELESALRSAATYDDGPIVVHVLTEKGRGYAPAEDDDEKHFHDIAIFDPATGSESANHKGASYTKTFTNILLESAENDPKIVAITAAMPGSTGLIPFQKRFPDRFFDVGIAEQHALTSAAGMARAGLRPVVAIYSTFLARAFDQALYDVGLHRLPVIFCIDRAGITGADGASHHGIFDISMYARIPGMTIFAPSSIQELEIMFREALNITAGPTAIRWPKGIALESDSTGAGFNARSLSIGKDVCLISAGNMLTPCMEAATILGNEGIEVSIWDARVLKPIDPKLIANAHAHPLVVTVEDGVRIGGFGSLMSDALQRSPGLPPRLLQLGVSDAYIGHGNVDEIHAELGLNGSGIASTIRNALEL
ncbi:MAG: 1-deoxy-D-xylulose-5-phosphate synthase [Actinomycetota bacterium]|nr:1-deoxy-D-xylulose-5-phosphate synthase [Actinomycetota bacterium]MDG2121709.1 1-deoxy-D-xylulose-5-phosphate synthase [Actinomycetota bacterium]